MNSNTVFTKDQEERAAAKARLKAKFNGVLSPPPAKEAVPQVLLLSQGYETMPEQALLFTLANNPELQHSAESAATTVNMLKGRTVKPANVKFATVQLTNPTPIPEFAVDAPVQRKASKPAPGFSTPADTTPIREGREELKKVHFKDALAEKIAKAVAQADAPVTLASTKVLLLPANYKEISEADLHFALVNDPTLRHSHDSALLAIEVLNGKTVKNTELKVSDSVAVELRPKTGKRTPAFADKARARDASIFGTTPPKLPPNYQELSESELHFALTHNAEFMHTPEVAGNVVDVLFGRRDSLPLAAPKAAKPTAPTEPEFEAVFKLPSNYKELSDLDLHSALLSVPELGHTSETALLTMNILRGWVSPPRGTTLKTVGLVVKPEVKEVPVKRNISPTSKLKIVDGPAYTPEAKPERPARIVELKTFLLPANYKDFTNDLDLHAALMTPGLDHDEESSLFTMRILKGWERPTDVILKTTDIEAAPAVPVPQKKWKYVAE